MPKPPTTGTPLRPALDAMAEAKRPTGPIAAILITLAIMVVGQLPAVPFAAKLPMASFGGQLLLTTSFIVPMVLFFVWVRFREQRPIVSLGFGTGDRRRPTTPILIGAGLGLALTSLTVGLNLALGTATLGRTTWGMAPLALVLLVGFAIQSSTEEIADRGYLMQAIAPRWGLVSAMVVQTVLFAALHGANGGLTWVAWANLCAVAVFLGLWVWTSGNLWGACAFHTFWNWSQGNLWGAPVSHVAVETSVGHFTPSQGASTLLTGGDFGLEGSIIPLVCFLAGSVVLVVLGRRTQGRQAIDKSRTQSGSSSTATGASSNATEPLGQ